MLPYLYKGHFGCHSSCNKSFIMHWDGTDCTAMTEKKYYSTKEWRFCLIIMSWNYLYAKCKNTAAVYRCIWPKFIDESSLDMEISHSVQKMTQFLQHEKRWITNRTTFDHDYYKMQDLAVSWGPQYICSFNTSYPGHDMVHH